MTPGPSRIPEEPEGESRVSRRAFFKAAGSGVLLTSAAAAAITFDESVAYAQRRWDREADVIAVGSGGAASSAAIFAHEGGARVLIVEKAAIYGGTTGKSGGVHWIPNNRFMRAKGIVDAKDDCVRYLARISFPAFYNPSDPKLGLPDNEYDLLSTFYDNASPTIDALKEFGALDQGPMTGPGASGHPDKWYPDYHAELPENKAGWGRSLSVRRFESPDSPVSGVGGGGAGMIRWLRAAIDKRGIPVLLEHRATRLVLNRKNEVVGLEVRTGTGQTLALRARKAVIFGSGGFTQNPEMCANYLRGPIFGGCTVPTGEGDFATMAASIGAKLANMNNAWWWPVIVEQALQSRSVPSGLDLITGDSCIQVNGDGRRMCSEKAPYNDRTQPHFIWDSVRLKYPNLVGFTIYDQFCRERFGGTGGGRTILVARPNETVPYILSAPTLEELAGKIEARLAEITKWTGNFRLDPDFLPSLRETIARFNLFAETGKDLDFHRGETPLELERHAGRVAGNDKPNPTMFPIASTGPYYSVMVAAGTLDTKGGPKINSKAQVLDAQDKPIAGLYGAGNCIGSPFAESYPGAGGTLGPALTFGAIAGKAAAAEPVKTV